jgi:hypothetical protein
VALATVVYHEARAMSLLVGPRNPEPQRGLSIMLETPVKPARGIDREGVSHPRKRWRGANARRAARGADAEAIHAFKFCAAEQGVLRAIDRWACGEFGTFTAAGVADELRPPLRVLSCGPVVLYFRGLALLLLGLGFPLRRLQRPLGARAVIWLTPPVAFAVGLFYLSLTLANGIGWQIAAALVFPPLSIMVLRMSLVRTIRKTLQDLAWIMMLIVLVPALGFACVEAVLVINHVAAVDEIAPRDPLLVLKIVDLLVWNGVNAIPLVDATNTLHWDYPFEYTTAVGGALVLVYKLLFLVPLSQLLTAAVGRLFGKD